MKKPLRIPLIVLALATLTACASNPSKPRVSAGASHSVPFTLGEETRGWLTNAVRFYPWSRGNKVRISTGVGVKPTANTNAGIGIDW